MKGLYIEIEDKMYTKFKITLIKKQETIREVITRCVEEYVRK
jgi:hypothetical protein